MCGRTKRMSQLLPVESGTHLPYFPDDAGWGGSITVGVEFEIAEAQLKLL